MPSLFCSITHPALRASALGFLLATVALGAQSCQKKHVPNVRELLVQASQAQTSEAATKYQEIADMGPSVRPQLFAALSDNELDIRYAAQAALCAGPDGLSGLDFCSYMQAHPADKDAFTPYLFEGYLRYNFMEARAAFRKCIATAHPSMKLIQVFCDIDRVGANQMVREKSIPQETIALITIYEAQKSMPKIPTFPANHPTVPPGPATPNAPPSRTYRYAATSSDIVIPFSITLTDRWSGSPPVKQAKSFLDHAPNSTSFWMSDRVRMGATTVYDVNGTLSPELIRTYEDLKKAHPGQLEFKVGTTLCYPFLGKEDIQNLKRRHPEIVRPITGGVYIIDGKKICIISATLKDINDFPQVVLAAMGVQLGDFHPKS